MFSFKNQNKKIVKNIEKISSSLPDLLVKRFSFFFLFIFLLTFFISVFLFRTYYLRVKDEEFKEYTSGLNEQVLDDIISEWKKREDILEQIQDKDYPELFKEKASPVTPEEEPEESEKSEDESLNSTNI
jgi:hypothetical protein